MNPGIIPRNESIPPDTMEAVVLFAQRFYMKKQSCGNPGNTNETVCA